jgi:AcrR family transcriptional regulator
VVRRTRPMARANRRTQLLQIARELVAEEGIGALTMMALSERARVAKPVVYSHFPNRESVAIALLDEHFESVQRFVHQRLAGAATLEEYFSRLVDASFEFESTSDMPVRRITNGFSADDDVNRAFLRHEEAFRDHWEQLLRHFGVPREAIEVAAYVFRGMMDNTVYHFAITPQKRVARETLKTMLLAAVHALAPGRARKQAGLPLFLMTSAKPARADGVSKRTAGRANGAARRARAKTPRREPRRAASA